jgi:hypothetical protein
LRISQITGALPGLDPSVDVIHDGGASLRRSGAHIANRMPEAVAGKNIIAIRLFLIDALSDLLNGENLLAIGREIGNGASLRAAKEMVHISHFAQTYR